MGWPLQTQQNVKRLPNQGDFHWRRAGEKHSWNPETIWPLQKAARTNNFDAYQQFAQHANTLAEQSFTLRGLLKFKHVREKKQLNINRIEPASEIVKRFSSGAMSFGSISSEAHETLAIAMNRIGCKSDSGEGGEDRRRYKIKKNGDNSSSAINHIASARFCVTSEYLNNCQKKI